LYLKESKALGEGRGNTFIVFLKRGGKEIAVKAVNSRVFRKPRRELYRKAKRDLRKPLKKMIGKSRLSGRNRTYGLMRVAP